MRPTGIVCAVTLLAAAACRDRSATNPAPRVADADGAPLATPPSVDAATAEAGDASPDAVDVADAADMKEYYSFEPSFNDAQSAYRASYEKMPSAELPWSDDVVVLCRVAAVEPAPLPQSKWDRANGRDLLVEAKVDDDLISRTEGPYGNAALHVRADEDLRRAPNGKRVQWVLNDRDQDHAYPFRSGMVIGTLDLPSNPKVPFRVSKPTMDVECRGAKTDDAAVLLLADADRALAEAETKATWKPEDPRGTFSLRDDVHAAAERIRIGRYIARSTRKKIDVWNQRVERLHTIVQRYLANARDAFAKIDPVPPGTWVRVGPTLSVRVGNYVCPAIGKTADPGSLNPEQRTMCGLALEMRSVTKVSFEANPWGPAYACRMHSGIGIDVYEGPAKTNGVCTLGIKRGGQWLKGRVELMPTEPTIMFLAGTNHGAALRIQVGEATALLAPPPPPDASE